MREKTVEQRREVDVVYSGLDQRRRNVKCRRVQDSEGYYYSPTVGWVCRRGLDRRSDDKDNY